MMEAREVTIEAKVVRGERAASGLAGGSPSTIAQQKPYFEAAGVKRINACYNGTINVDIAPRALKILNPDYAITAEWEPGETETFWLVDVVITHRGKRYPAYVYYPLPSPIKAHPDSIIELLAEKIGSLKYGDVLTVQFDSTAMYVP